MRIKYIALAAAFTMPALIPLMGKAADQREVEEAKILAGKFAFFDRTLSSPSGQSCADCHGPLAGWTGPVPAINMAGAVYPGANHHQGRVFGNRKPPSSAYATKSPLFNYFTDDGVIVFYGGNFWDGRATGWVLGNPAADQAMGPFVNEKEQNSTEYEVCQAVADSRYAYLFETAFPEVDNPLDCETDLEASYGRIALAIGAYEDSAEVNQKFSRFDAYWNACIAQGYEEETCAGAVEDVRDDLGLMYLSEAEWDGFELFVGKGNCAACHPAPEFTDHTYDNLGVPKNPDNPVYEYDNEDSFDPGLGGFLECLAGVDNGLCDEDWRDQEWVTSVAGLTPEQLSALAEDNLAKHKVPTLRNVDKRPGKGFVKAYTHNGVFKSLGEVVHFYNTRDVEIWPAPEYADTMNLDELGDLGLTADEEALIVKFMQTLSDTERVSPPKLK